jgi:5-methylcytosine-specific restriction endonuclease McrA
MPRRIPTLKPRHQPDSRRLYERQSPRQTDKDFYRSTRWLRLRDLVRAEEPLCRECRAKGLVVATEAIDHILDRKERPDLALDRENLQGLCKGCHNAKRRDNH